MLGTNGFKKIKKGECLPEQVVKTIEENNGFKYPCDWFTDHSFIRGDDFIVTTDDGGFYKVGASWMVWSRINGRFSSHAIWTGVNLKTAVKALMESGKTVRDPNYQT